MSAIASSPALQSKFDCMALSRRPLLHLAAASAASQAARSSSTFQAALRVQRVACDRYSRSCLTLSTCSPDTPSIETNQPGKMDFCEAWTDSAAA